MAVAFVRATYTEEAALAKFMVGIFGWGRVQIAWKRGRFQCTVPRRLNEVASILSYFCASMTSWLTELIPSSHRAG